MTASDNSSSSRTGTLEDLAPLFAASRGRPTGRVRSLDEARRTLGIPASSEPEVLQLWGTPRDFQLIVYPVSEPDAPDRVAEFALLHVVKRRGKDLVLGGRRTRLALKEKSNALWIVYGAIATATDGALVIESLAIGPAFEDQLGRKGDDIALGVTSAFLRLISPQRILAACAEQLQRQGYWLDVAATAGQGPEMSAKQRTLLRRVDRGRPRHAPIDDEHLAELAMRYLVLYQRGNRHPRAQLAGEFGLTPTQVRDRLHKARRVNYLTAATQGRAGAQPGPRLIELGWAAPDRIPRPTVVQTDNIAAARPKRRRRPKYG